MELLKAIHSKRSPKAGIIATGNAIKLYMERLENGRERFIRQYGNSVYCFN
jgi:hypothetical protein